MTDDYQGDGLGGDCLVCGNEHVELLECPQCHELICTECLQSHGCDLSDADLRVATGGEA